MATIRTIPNAWVERTLPDIFYEQPEPPEDALVQERTVDRLKRLLWERFEEFANVFITGVFYICYDMDDGRNRVQPDTFIAFDVDAEAIRRNLPNYWVWEVGKVPDFVMEVASPTTAGNDLGRKRDKYAELGIAEYWLFDPTGGELYGQPLRGENLVEGEYRPYDLTLSEDGSVSGYSELLDLVFHWNGEEFDVLNPLTGRTIDKTEVEREGRLAEREGRLAAEARVQELLEEISRLRNRES